MKVWAIADLHLPFGDPNKSMHIFGPQWEGYTDKIKENWLKCIEKDDLVLIAGDISWAMKLEQAMVDLEWIHALPGTKVMIRGNHDYWWSSPNKIRSSLPSSIHIIQNDVFNWHGFSIAGSRLWDSDEFGETSEEDKKIFDRELGRLEMSLKALDPSSKHRIAMTHYPPIGPLNEVSKASKLLEKYGVDVCVFGHLHNLKPNTQSYGKMGSVRYFLTSCDYLNFNPIIVYE